MSRKSNSQNQTKKIGSHLKKFGHRKFFWSISLSLLIAISSGAILFARFNSQTADKSKALVPTLAKSENDELWDFLKTVNEIETDFIKLYDISRSDMSVAIKKLQDNETAPENKKHEYINNAKKAARKLDLYKAAAAKFSKSKNTSIVMIAKELCVYQQYANKVLDHHQDFFSAPSEYISSEERFNEFAKYKGLLADKHEQIIELIGAAAKAEENKDRKVEFQFTKEELKDMEKWKKKSLDDMMFDAMDGDPAAMYNIGMCLVYGHGMTINVDLAHSYFAAAASLGYAPALNKIVEKYADDINSNDDPNLFLCMVYINLTSSFGHPEFTITYHKFRTRIVELYGKDIINEIERLALSKESDIIAFQKKLKNGPKLQVGVELVTGGGIVGLDHIIYNADYWKEFLKAH